MNMKRMRGRNHRGGNGGGGGGGPQIRQPQGGVPLNRNHVFDSNGPDVRIRGTAQQLFEKYLQLGRDATSGGDRVMAEGYFQHAEHYFRILNAMNQAAGQSAPTPRGPRHQDQGDAPAGEGESAPEGEDVEAHVAASIPPLIMPAGLGEQPVAEMREIPIAQTPPEE
jgi:hypothetical protein